MMKKLKLRMWQIAVVCGLVGCGDGQNEPEDDGLGVGSSSTSTGLSGSTTGAPDPCVGDLGCWSCEVVLPVQLLNRCTGAGCEPFANTRERLPLLAEDGSLPPLP